MLTRTALLKYGLFLSGVSGAVCTGAVSLQVEGSYVRLGNICGLSCCYGAVISFGLQWMLLGGLCIGLVGWFAFLCLSG